MSTIRHTAGCKPRDELGAGITSLALLLLVWPLIGKGRAAFLKAKPA